MAGNLALFVWLPARPDLLEGEEDEDDVRVAKVEPVILGSTMEAMRARLEQNQALASHSSSFTPGI